MRLMHLDKLVIGLPGECWPWSGALSNGYAQGYDGTRNRRMHRFVYEIVHGAIPAGLTIDHLCGNKACCNPAHLEAVTQGENQRRANVGKVQTAEHRARISAGVRKRGAKQTPEGRARIAKAKRAYWAERRKTHPPKRVRSEAYMAKRRVHAV